MSFNCQFHEFNFLEFILGFEKFSIVDTIKVSISFSYGQSQISQNDKGDVTT